MFGLDLFKSSKDDSANNNNNTTWNPATLTMDQPRSPAAPSSQHVVAEQPGSPEQMQLRGGSKGDVCCGLCAGLACFECCEICC